MTEKPPFNLSLIEAERRSRFDPLRNFTPERLVSEMDNFRAGHLRGLARIIDAQEERDDVLSCVVPKAKASVCRHGWDIIIGEVNSKDEEKLAEEQKKVLRHYYNNLRVTSALDQDELGTVSLLLKQMMDAKGKRYACHNIQWRPMGRYYSATMWHVPLWFFENSTGRMRFIEEPYGYYGTDMDPAAWLVTRGQGVGIACAAAWTYKHLGLRDWVIYSGRHGMPGVEGITDAQPGSEEWERMVQAVNAAANEFKWVRNRTNEIKTIDFSASGELPFPALVERMDRALSALWRGADLSTISAGEGQGQGASLQGEESDIIEQADAQWLSETLQLKVDRQVLDYVFGPDVPTLAYFQVLGANRQNVDQDLKIDEFAIRNGHPISKQQFAERYSRPLPDTNDMDDLLAAPAPVAPVAPAADGAPAVKPDPEAEEAINEASAGRSVLFKSEAVAQAGPEVRAAITPLVKRLAEIHAMDDAAKRIAALRRLQAALPEIYRAAVAKVPAAARIFEDIAGSAFLSGAAEHAAAVETTSQPAKS